MELPLPGLVILMAIGVANFGGSGQSLSLALTNILVKLSVLLRLRHGLGTIPSSVVVGLMIFLIDLVSNSGVYLTLRKVSNVCLSTG